MSTLVSDTGDTSELLEALYRVHADLDERLTEGHNAISEAINHVEWLEKGNEEWRKMYLSEARQAKAARATARVAISHLQSVLNTARTAEQQMERDTAARDWLLSIGSEPT